MFEKIDEMEEKIADTLGIDVMLKEILNAMSYKEKKAIFEYIIRMYDLDEEEEEV